MYIILKVMKTILIKLFKSFGAVLHGDVAVMDRWFWLNRNLDVRNGKILDVGCGSGAFSFLAARKGNAIVGVSIEERNNKVASKRGDMLGIRDFKFITSDVKNLIEVVENEAPFQGVICFETIEHIMDDKKLIKNISSLLEIGGKLFITTPYRYHKNWEKEVVSPVENGDHVRHGYTQEEMKEILEKTGFEVLRQDYLSGMISQNLIFLQRRFEKLLSSSLFAWILVFPLRLLQIFDKSLSKVFRYPHLCIGVVARKKKF